MQSPARRPGSVFRPVRILISVLVLLISGCDRQQSQNTGKPECAGPQTEQLSESGQATQETKPADSTSVDAEDTKISLLTDPDSHSLNPELAGECPIEKIENYTEPRDFDAIKRHGKLRILVDIDTIASLHRAATRQDLAKQHPGIVIKVMDTNYVDLAVEVSQKDIDFTILDDAALSQVMQFLSDLKKTLFFRRNTRLPGQYARTLLSSWMPSMRNSPNKIDPIHPAFHRRSTGNKRTRHTSRRNPQ
ncbi:hypothetical protein [Microbulbifer mangrovi]|uniref:hypothetical protein n=1 Tax=Microbulbifer mangrovi TaxID=927787 RepID=UPI00117D4E33|nr:hypothetical protein [Microbulbifer mangrovi]